MPCIIANRAYLLCFMIIINLSLVHGLDTSDMSPIDCSEDQSRNVQADELADQSSHHSGVDMVYAANSV